MSKDIDLALMVGIQIPIPSLQLIVHSPTVKEIAFMGEDNFFRAMQYLCIDKAAFDQGETVLSNMSNFQVFMKVLEQSDNKQNVRTLLMLLFPDYQVMMMPRSLNIMQDDKVVMIDDQNFDEFQEIIKQVLSANSVFQGKNVIYKPEGKKAKKIADKIMRNRQKIAKQKASEEGDSSILTRYLSILRIGPRIPLAESTGYNLFQLFDQVARYNAYVEWDTDLQVRLAGGTPDKQVETWMRNLYSMK